MILLLIDFLLSLICSIPTYFILLNIIIIPKNKIFNLVIIGLVLDLLILNTYFINTIILVFLFLIYKRLKISNLSYRNYFISFTSIYFAFIFIISITNHELLYMPIFILKNYPINFIIYTLFYKIINKKIK